jgi:type IV pilus assembly protein PilY1
VFSLTELEISKNSHYLKEEQLMTIFKLKHMIGVSVCITFNSITIASNLTQTNFTISSSQLANQPFIFQAGFNPNTWSGSLQKRSIAQHANGQLAFSPMEVWDAGVLLTTQVPDKRLITTYNHVNKQTVSFEWAQLPADIQKQFNKTPNSSTYDKLGSKRVEYLRGERAQESHAAQPFRVRESVLGDIVNSAPVYVGAPSKNIIGADYAAFYSQYKTRPGTVFVNYSLIFPARCFPNYHN